MNAIKVKSGDDRQMLHSEAEELMQATCGEPILKK